MTEDNQRTVTFQHYESKDYKVATVDAAVINSQFDGTSTTIKITFTRLDAHIISEKVVQAGDSLTVKGPDIKINSETRKIKEFAAMMRPDHALELAQALLLNLQRLDEEQIARYKLPKIALDKVQDAESGAK